MFIKLAKEAALPSCGIAEAILGTQPGTLWAAIHVWAKIGQECASVRALAIDLARVASAFIPCVECLVYYDYLLDVG